MNAYLASERVAERGALKFGILIVACVFFVCVQFRFQLLNGFSVLYGDSYDAAIVVAILEHWYSVFRGLSEWSELYYFYPYKNTLGQTDGYFLIGIIYSAIRSFGLDPFLSSELSNMVVRSIGFFSFFVLARKAFSLSFWWALLGAALFIISNNLTVHGQRLQLSTVSFAPIMAIFLWYTYRAIEAQDKSKIFGWGAASGVFLGAWSISCFYITWFFIYFFVFYLVVVSFVVKREQLIGFLSKLKSSYVPVLAVCVVSVVSLLPLLSVYLPKSKEVGMRSYQSALGHTVPLQDIVQTGQQNYLFGEIYAKFLSVVSPRYVANGEYHNTGIAPILFFLFVVGVVLILRTKVEGDRAVLWRAIALTTIITWLGVVKVGGHSAWFFLYTFFPGAKALNVVSVYQIVLSLPVILIALRYLSRISDRLPVSILVLVVALLGLEELNKGYMVLDRHKELAKVAVHSAPPKECLSFYVSGWPDQDPAAPMSDSTSNFYAHNVSAMLIAELIRLPTLNGIASFSPKDWNFAYPNWPDYDQRMKNYADAHNLTNVCKLELKTLEWSRAW